VTRVSGAKVCLYLFLVTARCLDFEGPCRRLAWRRTRCSRQGLNDMYMYVYVYVRIYMYIRLCTQCHLQSLKAHIQSGRQADRQADMFCLIILEAFIQVFNASLLSKVLIHSLAQAGRQARIVCFIKSYILLVQK
jgi:hypothetical protein